MCEGSDQGWKWMFTGTLKEAQENKIRQLSSEKNWKVIHVKFPKKSELDAVKNPPRT